MPPSNHPSRRPRAALATIGLAALLAAPLVSGCEPAGGTVTWAEAFDTSGAGALSGVWGSGPEDVFVVGGTPDQGEVHHFDGTSWSEMQVPAGVPLLVWTYGFGRDDVYAVGVGGGAIRYDGVGWSALDTGTDEDLWGVWGAATDDVWVVGGVVGDGEPVILHWDGATFSPVGLDPAENTRGASSLFKVWGIGGKTFAVGESGLIVEWDGAAWRGVSGGANADDDFVSLWGTAADHIVAVGGRSNARIARYDGTSWTTEAPSGVGGLNAVFMGAEDEAVVGGIYGYTATFDPGTGELAGDPVVTDYDIHAIWGDGAGRHYAVGGHFFEPYTGVALVRTVE